jgi:hypothetical protein
VFFTENYAHAVIPRQAFQAEQRAVSGQAGDRHRLLRPRGVQIVEPQIGDVAVDRVDGCTELVHLAGKGHASGKPLVEYDLVERLWLENRLPRDFVSRTNAGKTVAAIPA